MDNYELVSVYYVGNPKLKQEANSKNYLVELKDGNFILKQIDKKHIDKNSVKKLSQMIWCKNNGILVPKIYYTIKFKSFTSLNNHYWILMEYIEFIFSGTEEHLRKVLETAKLIKVLKFAAKIITYPNRKVLFFNKKKKIFLKLTSLNQNGILFLKSLWHH